MAKLYAKDYRIIALILAQARADCDTYRERVIVSNTAARFADWLQANPKFDRLRFMEAVEHGD